MLRLAYNTHGFPEHEVAATASILAGLGYAGISITPDVFHLNPLGDGLRQARELQPRLRDLGLAVAVETGARFLLDPRRKHQPTLLGDPPLAARRLDMLKRCHDIAVALQAETLSFWSGAGESPDALERLCGGARALLDHAAGSGVRVCFEPEPGMAVASLGQLADFLDALDRPELHVMLDVGHVPVTEAISPGQAIAAWAGRLGGVQLDDCKEGRHEHLFFGEGAIDFGEVRVALEAGKFSGLAAVELPRHVSDPVDTARRAAEFFGR